MKYKLLKDLLILSDRDFRVLAGAVIEMSTRPDGVTPYYLDSMHFQSEATGDVLDVTSKTWKELFEPVRE